MLHDEEKLKQDVKDLRLGRRSIRFGATPTIGEYLLPERLAAYMKRNPRVDVHMLVENTQILLRMINDGELDFAVVEGYFRKSEYDYIIWSQEPYVCVCAAAHPLAQAAPAPQRPVRGEPHPAQPGLRLPRMYGQVLEERNHHVGDFRHIVEISDLFVIKELVKADCGITFLYRKAVEKELAEGSLCQVALTDFGSPMSSPSSGGRTAPLRRAAGDLPGPVDTIKTQPLCGSAITLMSPAKILGTSYPTERGNSLKVWQFRALLPEK